MDRKIVDLSDAELTSLGFLGDAASPGIVKVVQSIKANSEQLGYITCLMLDCMREQHTPASPQQDVPQSSPSPNAPRFPISPTPSDPETLSGSDSDAHTIVAPHLISNYERHFYYHGISRNPPKLLYRSDLETNPFPIPQRGSRFAKIPYKTVNGVFNTPLNPIWDGKVFPRVSAEMKSHGIKWSSINTARFTTVTDGNVTCISPIVIWTAVRPNTTTAEALRDATPDILQIFTEFQITDVVLEWYEGEKHHLAGPPLMKVVNRTNPTFGLNHAFNTGLGIPIARESDGSQGTLALLFKEMKTREGKDSDRVLGVTNKHVACKVTTEDYEFDGTNPQYILVCGEERLERAIKEIQTAVSTGVRDATRLIDEVSKLEAKVGTPEEDSRSLRRIKTELEDRNEDNQLLETFLSQIKSEWQNGDRDLRRLGVVEWAPKISIDVDQRHYTRDLATFVIDPSKPVNFERNVVDLGNKFTTTELEDLFWPIDATREGRTIPVDHQLPISRALPKNLTINPDTKDQNGDPLYIVAKYGNATNLTLGRYSGMSGYTCDEFEGESREVAVYNYTKNLGYDTCGDFSDHGDSGSLIFTGSGDGLAMLHSGTAYGSSNHVTYGTPLWWIMEQIRTRYPFAEFYGIN